MIEQDPHESNELQYLREENARLKVLLASHGISWEAAHTTQVQSAPAEPTPAPQITTTEKIALFRRLFRGRADVYPQRWDSAKGTSGYAPACGNEWRRGTCSNTQVVCTGSMRTSRMSVSTTSRKGASAARPNVEETATRLPSHGISDHVAGQGGVKYRKGLVATPQLLEEQLHRHSGCPTV